MIPEEISSQLERIAHADDFEWQSNALLDQWASLNVGFESVEPILRFMEEHPSIEFGTPGPLVHFVEKYYRKGYEEKLLESISRKPTSHTVWMLNRLINGTKAPDEKQRLVVAMVQAKQNSLADPLALAEINRFLERVGAH